MQGLLGTVGLLAATVATLFASGLSSEDGETAGVVAAQPAPVLDSDELLALGRRLTPAVAGRVAAIRELEFDGVPEPRISDVARLRRVAEQALARPGIQRDLAIGEAELRLLGLLDEDQSLGEVATDVTASAAAYYDPERDELFLVGDAVPAGPALTEFLLSHELTHALEDEHFGLPDESGLSDDSKLAEAALVEGSATALMGLYANRHLNPFALAAEATELDAGTGGELPRFAEAEIDFTYLEGQAFVDALRQIGGGWKLVDYAYEERPPATTEHVLHADKYLEDEQPLPVDPPASPGPGWRAVDTGSLGEFATREVLNAGTAGLGADLGAAGWGGDTYRLFVREGVALACEGDCRGSHALGVSWRGDDRAEAAELKRVLGDYVLKGLGGEATGADAWRLEGGWARVRSAGDGVALGLAPTRAEATRLLQPAQ